MILKEARLAYRKNIISFDELNKVFNEQASEEELELFFKTPVFDRAGFIMGKRQNQLDAE